jgi:hypothetical protein
MGRVAGPRIIRQIADHAGTQRIGLHITQHREQMLVALKDRAFETPLPDMPDALVVAVVMPGVCHRQGLQDAANRLPVLGLQNQVEVIAHEAIAEEAKGIAQLGLGKRFEEGPEITSAIEDPFAVMPRLMAW